MGSGKHLNGFPAGASEERGIRKAPVRGLSFIT
nr:MAG: hypothetical protein [Bacteriophage sp.]